MAVIEQHKNIYNEVIGITKDNELVVLESVFHYSKGFNGATGWIMSRLYQDEIDERTDLETIKEEYSFLWEEAVKSHSTELGLEDYLNELIEKEEEDPDTYFIGDDPSFRFETDKAIERLSEDDQKKLNEVLGEKGKDFVDWDCSSCGRCIPTNEDDYKVIFNRKLLVKAQAYEGK